MDSYLKWVFSTVTSNSLRKRTEVEQQAAFAEVLFWLRHEDLLDLVNSWYKGRPILATLPSVILRKHAIIILYRGPFV